MERLNDLSGHVVDSAIRISRKLGPGLLESVYETVLARDLSRRGLFVERQKLVSFDFEGLWFENALRLDILVERILVVEVKCVRSLTAADTKQALTYLRLCDCKLALILNFGAPTMKEGIKRVIL